MSKVSQRNKKAQLKNGQPRHLPSENEILLDMLSGDIDWKKISSQNLPIEFIRKYQDHLDWEIISSKSNMPKRYLTLFKEKLKWDYVCACQTLATTDIKLYADYVHWPTVARYSSIDDEIYDTYFDELYLHLNLHYVFANENAKLSCKIVDKYSTYYDSECWKNISQYLILEEWFIDKYAFHLHWKEICKFQKLSPTLIAKYHSLIKWNHLNNKTIASLPINFIIDHVINNITDVYKVYNMIKYSGFYNFTNEIFANITNNSIWSSLSRLSDLPIEFICMNLKKLNTDEILKNPDVSDRIKKQIKEML